MAGRIADIVKVKLAAEGLLELGHVTGLCVVEVQLRPDLGREQKAAIRLALVSQESMAVVTAKGKVCDAWVLVFRAPGGRESRSASSHLPQLPETPAGRMKRVF